MEAPRFRETYEHTTIKRETFSEAQTEVQNFVAAAAAEGWRCDAVAYRNHRLYDMAARPVSNAHSATIALSRLFTRQEGNA